METVVVPNVQGSEFLRLLRHARTLNVHTDFRGYAVDDKCSRVQSYWAAKV